MILGIDVGNHGAIAQLSHSGELVDVRDMPVLRDGPKGRPTLNAPLLWAMIAEMHAGKAFVEEIRYMPTDGGQGAFAFGQSYGMVKMALAAACVSAEYVPPQKWKRAMGLLKASKDASRSEAIRRWPGQVDFFKRVKDDGRAEAALIAAYGLAMLNTRTVDFFKSQG